MLRYIVNRKLVNGNSLYYELTQLGLYVERQNVLPLVYEDMKIYEGSRVDILVDNRVVVEIKSVETVLDVHLAQILTYMKLSGCKLGLLVNYNVKHLKNGIKRVINT